VRVRALGTFIGSLTVLATGAPAALAVETGGVSPASSSAPAAPAPTSKPAAPLHAAPVTARSPRLSYKGPVYERLPSGEVVPYQPPLGRRSYTGPL